MTDIIPSNRGKLPSEPDQERFFGVEFEFHPESTRMSEWRELLYAVGIDTLDDANNAVDVLRDRAMVNRNPELWRQAPSSEQCQRATSIISLLSQQYDSEGYALEGRSNQQNSFTRALLQRSSFAGNLEDLRTSLGAWRAPVRRSVLEVYPRLDNVNGRLWSLITDPTAGLELRTPPLKIGEDPFSTINAALTCLDHNSAVATPQCGTHIHMDVRNDLLPKLIRMYHIYRLLEPLIAACIQPYRYSGAYNKPLWEGRNLTTNQSLASASLSAFAQAGGNHTTFLDTGQINHHGSIEFRMFEGTVDPTDAKMWVLLINRFMQAAIDGPKWGIKMKGSFPLGVSIESIKDFLRFLDIVRTDVHSDLKEMRAWYIEKVRLNRESRAFQRALVHGHTNEGEIASTNKMTDLKKLKESGVSVYGTVLLDTSTEESEFNAVELGKSFMNGLMRIFLNASMIDGNAGSSDMHGCGASPLDVFVSAEHGQNICEVACDYFEVQELSEDSWQRFATAIHQQDHEAIGNWIEDNINNAEDPADAMTNLTSTLQYIVQYYAASASHADNRQALETNTGVTQCVDF